MDPRMQFIKMLIWWVHAAAKRSQNDMQRRSFWESSGVDEIWLRDALPEILPLTQSQEFEKVLVALNLNLVEILCLSLDRNTDFDGRSMIQIMVDGKIIDFGFHDEFLISPKN